MQIKQTDPQPHKDEEIDSDSYVMPILHIPNKAQRELFLKSVIAESKTILEKKPNPPAQKIFEQKVESKIQGPTSKVKNDKVEHEKDQFLQKKEGKRGKREIKNYGNNKKEEIKTQKKESPPQPKVQKRGRPRKEVKIERQVKRERLENEVKIKKPQKEQKIQIQQPQKQSIKKTKQVQFSQQPKFKEPNPKNVYEKKESIGMPVKQQRKQEREPKLKFENIKKEANKVKRRRQSSSSDSSSSSSSSDSDSSKNRRRKTKKIIKLKLTNLQKKLIWKNRYLRARQKIKQTFFQYKRCPRHHPMRNLIHDPDKSAYRLVCQKCRKDLHKNCLVYWECDPCRYLVCAQCQGFNWNKCPYGHPTKKSQHFRGQKTCDVCLQPRYVGGLTCPCNFDICGSCELKAKRFNQTGQEIISLQSQA